MKIPDLLKDWRILLYLALIVISVVVLIPTNMQRGVKVSMVEPGSKAEEFGIMAGMFIKQINDCPVQTISDYYRCLNKYSNESRLTIITDQGILYIENYTGNLGISVTEVKPSIVNYGIDIVGGWRVVLKPETKVDASTLQIAKNVIETRLNVNGLKDVSVKIVQDFTGEQYIVVELPSGEESLLKILESQGKFEAKLNNVTVFTGRDVRVLPASTIIHCERAVGGVQCYYSFGLSLTERAARKFYEVAKNLEVVSGPTGEYLNSTLDLYLDGKLVDSLRVSSVFKERPLDKAEIRGSVIGTSYKEARESAEKNVKFLQSLISNELPVKLNIVNIERISPVLGESFLKEVALAGLAALFGVALIIFLKYRNIKIAGLLVGNMLVEAISTLAVAKIIGWTMDLPSLIGIVVSVGTGIDDQIIITDELLRGESEKGKEEKISEKVKRAFFIIISSYLAYGAATFFLYFTGVGILRGFAITTLIGITIGSLITRPAYAKILEKIL